MQLTQTHLPLMKNDFLKLGVVESQTLHRFVLVSKFSVRNTKRREINFVSERSISNGVHSVVLLDTSLIRSSNLRNLLCATKKFIAWQCGIELNSDESEHQF
jgi:hypothetical protein